MPTTAHTYLRLVHDRARRPHRRATVLRFPIEHTRPPAQTLTWTDLAALVGLCLLWGRTGGVAP